MAEPQFEGGGMPSLSDAINKLMANPEIISTVASALGGMEKASDLPSASSDAEQKQGDLPENSLNTEPVLSDSPPPQGNRTSSVDMGELMKSIAPMMSMLQGVGSQSGSHSSERYLDSHKREALLCALKPYVSDGRREAIDHIIRISQVSDILKNIGQQH